MSVLFFKTFLMLLRFEPCLRRENFAVLHERVRNYPISRKPASGESVERICSAVDLACIWYWKQVQCLQRSAATTCLLRRHGVAAQMVIGVQQIPFKAHAWVEVGGRVVNDRLYLREMYSVLDEC